MSSLLYKQCTLCPRECKADRTVSVGFCGMGDKLQAARAMIHTGEEPCISGTMGSGAVFFSGCVLKCVFCQNSKISHGKFGKEVKQERLSEIFLELQAKRVHNINIVSGTQFYPSILSSLDKIKEQLTIPVVWNTGGYEKIEAVDRISEYCSIFLQDIKFRSSQISLEYASCSDYYDRAIFALERMILKVGRPLFDKDGMLLRGVIIRHLILPSHRKDSINLLKDIKEQIGTEDVILSLMSQYTPPNTPTGFSSLDRRLTDFEYKSVCEVALELGFNGYFQAKESASAIYTPEFDLRGL